MQTGFIAFLLITLVSTGALAARGGEKKLIEYGWDAPNSQYYREHVRTIEKVGFDGVVIRIERPDVKGSLTRRPFSRTHLDPVVCEMAVKDLQASPSSILTENLVQLVTQPGDVDWFDSDWKVIAENAAMLARVAKLGNCRGLMIDPEEYGPNKLWTYSRLAEELKAKHTFEEYRIQVRQRGREFIQAINREYPGITILLLLGPSFSYQYMQRSPRAEAKYNLLFDFVDGMCEGADEGTTIIDGYEQSYHYRRELFFQLARQSMLKEVPKHSAVPEAFKRHMRVGFGVWADNDSGKLGWNGEDFSTNYYSPEELRNTIAYALKNADQYVWVYCERFNWWTREKMPEVYRQALISSRLGPVAVNEERNYALPARPASTMEGYSDQETFKEFYLTLKEVYDFPRDNWRFSRDPMDIGRAMNWQGTDFDDSGWRKISIGDFWENQGEHYDGVGWYRIKVNVPILPKTGRVYLVVGAADEAAWVYVNGQYAGRHVMGELGWDRPFKVDVTDLLLPGKPNLVAIRVLDTGRLGGLWKSVKLMVEK